MNIGDKEIIDNISWTLVKIEYLDNRIEFTYRESTKLFLENMFLKIGKDSIQASSLFPINEYPICIKDRVEIYIKINKRKE